MKCVKLLLLPVLACGLLSCQSNTTRMGDEKAGDCGEIPVGVTLNTRELDVAGATMADFSLGKLEVKETPQFQKIISEADSNSAVTDVLVCKTIARAGVRGNPELVDYFTRMTHFFAGHPSINEQLQWRQTNPFPNKRSKAEVSEQEVQKPKVEITFNGLSQEAIKSKFPIPLVLEPTQTAILLFVVANVGDGPLLNAHVSIDALPDTVRVGRPGTMEAWEERPNHNHIEIKAKASLPTMKISGGAYSFKVEVRVPEVTTERFNLLFKIYADNLPHQELGLVFRPIHEYKQPAEAK